MPHSRILWRLLAISVVGFFLENERKTEGLERTSFALQSLVYVLGAYFIARTFDDSTKSLEELCARLRKKK